jgi:hypothetical protein
MTYEEDLASRADEDGSIDASEQLEAAANELLRLAALPGVSAEAVASLKEVASDLYTLTECV